MKLSRRQFLALLAAVGSSACVGDPLSDQRTRELMGEWPDRVDGWTPTICRECPGGCGLLARTVDGRVVGLLGNPFHPVNRGSICPRGLGALQTLYDPARLVGPQLRDSGVLRSSSWDDAIGRVGAALRQLRDGGHPEHLVVLMGEIPLLRQELWERFCRLFGTPHLMPLRTIDRGRPTLAERVSYGARDPVAYDWGKSDLVLSFAAPLFDGGTSPLHQHRDLLELRGRGGRLIQIESRLSATGSRADDWIAVAPGSEAAIALTLGHLLAVAGRIDPAVERLPGFQDWRDEAGVSYPGFAALLRENWDLNWCERVTGAPIARVQELAAEFQRAKTPIALVDPGWQKHANGLYSHLAVAALNLVGGSLGRVGGVSLPEPPPIVRRPVLAAGADISLADASTLSVARSGGLPRWLEAILHDSGDGAPGVVIVDTANPVSELPEGLELARLFERIDLVTTITTRIDETAQVADILLPQSHFLESFGEDVAFEVPGLQVYSIARPAIPPRADTRPAEEILGGMAAAVGEPLASAIPTSLEDQIRRRALGLRRAGGRIGDLPDLANGDGRQERSWLREIAGAGEAERDEKTFWRDLSNLGVWVRDREPRSVPLAAFAGPALRSALGGSDAAALARELGLSSPEAIFSAHYEGPVPNAKDSGETERPLHLVLFSTLGLGPRGSRAPWIQETLSPLGPVTWDSWAEINPRTAQLFGIREGQRVRVSSIRTSLVARALLTETARPGIVYLPLGQGRAISGADGPVGQNAVRLVVPRADLHRGTGLTDGTPVRVDPA